MRRRARGFSQETLAEAAGVDRTTVARWEAGTTDPQPWIRPSVARLLDVTLEQLEDLLTDTEPPRRGVATAAAKAGAEELRDRLRSAAAVDAQAIRLLADQVEQIRHVDRMLGADAARSQLRGNLATLGALRSFGTDPVQRRPLAGLYAQAATLAGWQSVDGGDLGAAWKYYEEAKYAAQEAGSTAGLAHAMAEQAYVLQEIDEPGAALQLADTAVSIAGTAVPSLLRCWLSAVVGELHARLGNSAEAGRAFDVAESLLPAALAHPELPYIVLGDVHLQRWRGSAMAALGSRSAVDQLREALDGLDGTFTRARAAMHVDLAGALQAAGGDREARAELKLAGDLATQVGSVRQRRRVRRLESVLGAARSQ